MLNLASNLLHDHTEVGKLASMSRLRELNLENNLLRHFPPSDEANDDFAHLEWVNLARNQIEDEQAIAALIFFRFLTCVVLFGNPMTEDPKAVKKHVLDSHDHICTRMLIPASLTGVQGPRDGRRASRRHCLHAARDTQRQTLLRPAGNKEDGELFMRPM